MAEIVGLYDYPLSGGQERSHKEIWLSANGFVLDRGWVLYDADRSAGERNRISRKKHELPELARVRATLQDSESVLLLEDGNRPSLRIPFVMEDRPDCIVNEFDTTTPAIDIGDEAAEWFLSGFPRSRELGRIRLAQKTSSWLLGFGTPAPERSVAPLHIVTKQSVEQAKRKVGSDNIDYRRFRPSVLIDAPEFDAGDERHWLRLRLGELVVSFKKETVRCEYIGQNPDTGEPLGDLSVAKLPVKSKFGIYVHTSLGAGDYAKLQLHDPVEVLERTV